MQELYGAGAPVDSMGIVSMVAATLVLLGNEAQRTEIVPRMLSVMRSPAWATASRMPDRTSPRCRRARCRTATSGSSTDRDVHDDGAQGRLRVPPHAHEPREAKAQRLTMFLVPMTLPGIEITPVHTLGGERTNITFYTDVRVPDACRVGEVDAGWSVMHRRVVYERNSANWGEPDRLIRVVTEWAQSSGVLDDPLVADRLALHATTMEVGRLLVFAPLSSRRGSGEPHRRINGENSSSPKHSRGRQRRARSRAPRRTDRCLRRHAYRHSTVTTIYGGSSEVQRGIIAEHGLGLPRAR